MYACTYVDSSLEYDDEPDAFSKPDVVTVKSGSSSCSELINALRLSRHNSTDSDHKSDSGPELCLPPQQPPVNAAVNVNDNANIVCQVSAAVSTNSSSNTNESQQKNQSSQSPAVDNKPISEARAGEPVVLQSSGAGAPTDLASVLEDLGLSKYLSLLEGQDIDLQVFLTLTDNDLKEIGVKYVSLLILLCMLYVAQCRMKLSTVYRHGISENVSILCGFCTSW